MPPSLYVCGARIKLTLHRTGEGVLSRAVKAKSCQALRGLDGMGDVSTLLMHGTDLLHHLLVANVAGNHTAGAFGVVVGHGNTLQCPRCGDLLPGRVGARQVDVVPPLAGGIERGDGGGIGHAENS